MYCTSTVLRRTKSVDNARVRCCSDLRDVGQGVADVDTKSVEVLPLLPGDWRSHVVGDDLRLVEKMLNDEHDRCGCHRTNSVHFIPVFLAYFDCWAQARDHARALRINLNIFAFMCNCVAYYAFVSRLSQK